MPSHELGGDFGDLRLQPSIFFSLGSEQLASQVGHVLIGLNVFEQRIEVRDPFGCGKAKLGGLAADGIRQLRAIADEPIAQADQHQGRLLFGSLYRHKTHRWPAHRLAKRLGVSRIVLVALYIRFDQLSRDQLYLMAERPQNPCPMVGGAAGFDPDHRRRKFLEELNDLLAPLLLAQNHLLVGVHPVKLEKTLRRIHADSASLLHGRPPLSEICNDLIVNRR